MGERVGGAAPDHRLQPDPPHGATVLERDDRRDGERVEQPQGTADHDHHEDRTGATELQARDVPIAGGEEQAARGREQDRLGGVEEILGPRLAAQRLGHQLAQAGDQHRRGRVEEEHRGDEDRRVEGQLGAGGEGERAEAAEDHRSGEGDDQRDLVPPPRVGSGDRRDERGERHRLEHGKVEHGGGPQPDALG